MASTKTIVRERNRAFQAQGGLCFYCDEPMLPSGNGARLRAFQCTAEHCIARQEGGKHAGNIVAAHALCNQRRHQAKKALDPDKFKQKVQQRMARGRWIDPKLVQRLRSDALATQPETSAAWRSPPPSTWARCTTTASHVDLGRERSAS